MLNFSINQKNKTVISFSGGVTPEIVNSIKCVNINKVSDIFAEKNIVVDFKDNKVIAWCSKKVLEIIEKCQREFNLNFKLPQSIIVNDFERLELSQNTDNMFGFCNFFPCKLYKKKDDIVSSRALFFNTFESYNKKQLSSSKKICWENIDSISDRNYQIGLSPTNYFLDLFFHEFAHAIHFENMLKQTNGVALLKKMQEMSSEQYLQKFKEQYRQLIVKNLCEYGAKNPLELIACDLSKRLSVFSEHNFNCFDNNIYKRESLIKRIFFAKRLNEYEKLIDKCFNNNF